MRRLIFMSLFCAACTSSHSNASDPPPVGTKSAVSATPRSDLDAERLALTLTPTQLTADQTIYERISRDLASIRAKDPIAAAIDFEAVPDPHIILLQFANAPASNYDAWDELNTTYRFTRLPPACPDFCLAEVELRTDAVYNLGLLFPLYAKLSGVQEATPQSWVGDDEAVPAKICVRDSGASYDYYFASHQENFSFPPLVAASTASWASVDASGAILSSGNWTEPNGGTEGPTIPAAVQICPH